MDAPEVEVAFVKATVRRLKGASLVVDHCNDLRPAYQQPSNSSTWVMRIEVGEYYKSTQPVVHKTGVIVPAGSYFICAHVERDRPFISEGFEDPLGTVLSGAFCVMETKLPTTDERIAFPFWVVSANYLQFNRIDNEMAVIAIAATGL